MLRCIHQNDLLLSKQKQEAMSTAWGAFFGTRVLELVKKHDSGGLVWKRIKLTPTRKANAKKRLRRVWQVHLLHLCFSIQPLTVKSALVKNGFN